jgi:hypothetical protein
MRDADIKRLFEAAGEKSGTGSGASGRHADVIDKMDNATSKADAAKFLDDKIGLLAAGIVNDRGNRGEDSKSGGGGGGGSSKGIEDGNKSTGTKSNDGKNSAGIAVSERAGAGKESAIPRAVAKTFCRANHPES